ncbi:MFS domain-containing protein [Gammaproteobacteria bacterium]
MIETSQASSPNLVRSWCVVLAAALFFFYIFIQMSLFNAISGDLIKEFQFNATQLGSLAAFYFYGNVLFLFPAGILLDRFSVRNLLLTAFAIIIIATYVFSTTSDFWIMGMARLAVGLAGAFAMLSAIKLATRWFEPRHMALVIGIVVTMAFLGGAIAQTPITLLTQSFGWRGTMQIISAFGALLMIIQFIVVRDEPKGSEKTEAAEHAQLEQVGFWRSLGMAIASMQNWLSGLYICLVNLPIFVFGMAWGVPYLTQIHHLTPVEATQATSMLFIGAMIGSPLAGIISDKMGLRKLPMLIGAILTLAALLIIMFAPDMPLWAVAGQFLFLGIVSSAQVIGYPVIAESNPHTITATASSLGSILIMSGGMLIPIFGWLLDMSGNPTHSLADFTRANSMMVVGLVIALIASLLIKETYCKQLNKN